MAKIIETKISELIPDDKNFNKGTEYGQKLIEDSLRKFGAGRSGLLDKNNRIIAGNKFTENAVNIGMEDCIIVESDGTKPIYVKRTDIDLDSKQGREMALADNATGKANLEWDEGAIAEASKQWELDAKDWGIDIDDTGWGNDAEAEEDDFNEDEEQVTPICKRGEVWQLGTHRLMCGDSTNADDVAKLMGGERADLCFTDPPYGVAIGDKNKMLKAHNCGGGCEINIINDTLNVKDLHNILVKAFTLIRENCKNDASYYVTSPQGGDLGMMMIKMMEESGLKVRHILIWVKNTATFSMGRLDYDYQHEPIFYTWTKTHHNYRNGKFRTSVWNINKPIKNDLHPTMKPVELVENCILDGTKDNDLVIDFFGGSGTTLIACEQLNRKCYMMELDEHYCDVIIARWEKLTGDKAVKLG
jgi:DNA modification methylase